MFESKIKSRFIKKYICDGENSNIIVKAEIKAKNLYGKNSFKMILRLRFLNMIFIVLSIVSFESKPLE